MSVFPSGHSSTQVSGIFPLHDSFLLSDQQEAFLKSCLTREGIKCVSRSRRKQPNERFSHINAQSRSADHIADPPFVPPDCGSALSLSQQTSLYSGN